MLHPHTNKIFQELQQALKTKQRASLIVSGGSSPVGIFNELSSCDLDWARIDIALVDERRVDTNHHDSNEKMVKNELLINKAAEANYISISRDPERVAKIGKPFDIVLLGMGEDGHFASLFSEHIMQNPDDINNKSKPNIIYTKPMGQPCHERISMNLSMILRSLKIYLLVSNLEKFKVLEKSITDSSFPVFYLLNQNKVGIEILGQDQ
tara:strand:+ start:408 stop:1034 length:627 start_codon:yes stop_codon:yes gene_type:complete